MERAGATRCESYDELRQDMIAETSAYVTECLRHPELAVRIPTVVCGEGSFPPSLAMSFWMSVLDD
jgi:hypothetical protein